MYCPECSKPYSESHVFCEACLEENIIRDMEESGEEVSSHTSRIVGVLSF